MYVLKEYRVLERSERAGKSSEGGKGGEMTNQSGIKYTNPKQDKRL